MHLDEIINVRHDVFKYNSTVQFYLQEAKGKISSILVFRNAARY
jgi:hypothetical protein